MADEELKLLIRQIIRDELSGIVEAVLERLQREKKAKEARYWADLTPEEYEKLYKT